VTDVWIPFAVKLPFVHSDGGSYVGGPPRGVLHTTQSWGYTPSVSNYYGHRNPPHVTIDRDGSIYQHFPANRAARGLKHPRFRPHTNRRSAFQIEVVGFAQNPDYPIEQVEALQDVIGWVTDNLGVEREAPLPFIGSEGWGTDAPSRMKSQDWKNFNAWCGHQHVPWNDHWDPGAIDPEEFILTSWKEPGDPVRNRGDAVSVARFQGGERQAVTVSSIEDESSVVMFGRVLDILMQHDKRIGT